VIWGRGRWFSLGTLVSSTNKTDRHDITEMLLKVALNTIKQTNKHKSFTPLPFYTHLALNYPITATTTPVADLKVISLTI
jgi:hypothetical protein